jgi:hypothetical protein
MNAMTEKAMFPTMPISGLWRSVKGRFVLMILLWLVLTAISGKESFHEYTYLFPGLFLFGGAAAVAITACKVVPRHRIIWANVGGVAVALLLVEIFCLVVLHAGYYGGPGRNVKLMKESKPIVRMKDNEEPDVVWTTVKEGRGINYFPSEGIWDQESPQRCRMRPNARMRSKRVVDGMIVYDVTYTTNEHGFRITPAAIPGKPTVAFWGCSFTFGMGLNDDQTLPNQFVVHSKGRFSAINFGLPGHSPNNALAFLEENGEHSITAGTNIVAGVYFTMDDHPLRVMGKRPGAKGYPRYVIRNGVAVRNGFFEDTSGYIQYSEDVNSLLDQTILKNLGKVAIADVLLKGLTGYDNKLYVAVLKRMAEIFEERYHAPFVVVTWLCQTLQNRAQYEALERAGLRLVNLKDLFREEHSIIGIPNDGHPTAYANAYIADRLLDRLEKMGIRTPATF